MRLRLSRWLSGLLGFVVVMAGVVSASPSPAQAEPDVSDVQARVERLYHEAEQAAERLNDARIDMADLRRDLMSLKADQDRQYALVGAAREDLQRSIVSQYEGQNLSTLGRVASSDGSSDFVSAVSTMSAYNDLQTELFDRFSVEAKALDLRKRATEQRLDEIKTVESKLEAEKATIEDKKSQAELLLSQLKEDERAALLSRDSVRLPTGISTSGRASAALQYAMAQVGKAYVWAAAGPNAFDCSGLTMMAWAQAGVALPHSSAAQFASGSRIEASELQPGDLVFYYTPISHVEMYIGDGLIVGAANPQAGVRVSRLDSMPYVGAVRPG